MTSPISIEFTFYCSSIKGLIDFPLYITGQDRLHSTVVLLKASTVLYSPILFIGLHSTVVLLKVKHYSYLCF